MAMAGAPNYESIRDWATHLSQRIGPSRVRGTCSRNECFVFNAPATATSQLAGRAW